MSINKAYTQEIKENLDYTATWLPNLQLSLGDVGVLSKYSFSYRTNLANLGVPFTEGKPGAAAAYSHTSSDAVQRDIKVAGKAPVLGSVLSEADAGITFSFSRKDAVVFLASNCTIRVIADQEPLRRAILQSYNAGAWDRDYVVVTELVSAAATTIIVSEGASARFELRAKAGLVPSFEAMNAEGNFALAHDSRIGFNCLATSGMTPLFRCLGVRTGWFRDEVTTRGAIVDGSASADSTGATKSVVVNEVDYDDYRPARRNE